MIDIDLQRRISSQVGLIIILIFGLIITIITINIGNKIIQSTPDSVIFNPDIRSE